MIRELDLFSLFLNNFNIMYILLLAELLISGVLFGVSKLVKSPRLKTVAKFLLKLVPIRPRTSLTRENLR